MGNISIEDIDKLTKRVELLENQVRMLAELLGRASNVIASESLDVDKQVKLEIETENKTETEHVINVDSSQQCSSDNGRNIIASGKFFRDDAQIRPSKPVSEDKEIRAEAETNKNLAVEYIRNFVEKYNSDSCEYDLYLDLGKDMIKSLKRYLEWQQIPEDIKQELYLVDAYDANVYYADCIQIADEFVFFVAPAEPDCALNESEMIRLALPQFYEINYRSDLGNKFIKLVKPAVFVQNELGGYKLQMKGKLIVAV